MRRLLSRIGFYIVALWASVTINFLLPRLMPGDPAQAFLAGMQGKSVTPQLLASLRAQFGVTNAPLWQQYFAYLNQLLHGDLGVSNTNYPETVSQILATSIPWTVGLLGVSVIIAFVIGTLLGILVAWRRGSWLDSLLPPVMTFISAIPYLWMALALVYFLGFILHMFPIGGGFDDMLDIDWTSMDFISSVVTHAILPAFTIVLGSISGWILVMRNSMVTTLSEDYVLMAQAKGLPTRRVVLSYAARNAILPSITSFSISLGAIVGGALLTELVFNYPGIGYALITAIGHQDYSLIEGCFLVIAVTVLAANLIADVVYTLLDPRVRQERS
ncbi:peptide ABC transporter permease [Dictyobacter vulcani]|uniref:Peptide ABC transporter permease n=1 Tax=Dictyobacter vulcani TaxID=2607529 RepID=A0A5J4KYB5_9CHLR|nr:ABC transporter permease [Dictyobacter vulcani]GER91557.1 peptide ABC transporter permease [Dictyobacter vulcani]